jgi:tetratricopeptide (TPR) repeat protein
MLHNLGVVYKNLGQDRRALQSYDQALSIRKELNDPQLQQETLQNIGVLYMNHGCYNAALRNYERALAVTDRSVIALRKERHITTWVWSTIS